MLSYGNVYHKMTNTCHHFHSKTLDIKINLFFSKFREYRIPPFSREMWIVDFLKEIPALFAIFRTRMGVTRDLT